MKRETAAEWFETHMPTGKVKPVQKQAYLMALAALRPVSQEQVEQYLYKIVDPLLHEFVDKETQDISIQDEDKQFVIDFFKYALVGMVLEWIRKDMKEDAPSPQRRGKKQEKEWMC